MKYRVGFKAPDAIEDAIKYKLQYWPNDENENPVMYGHRLNECNIQVAACLNVAQKFCSYMEYVIIEFDTEANTATVVAV